MVTIPFDWLNLVLGVVLPMLTALVTARFANAAVKSLVLALLSIIAVALQGILQNGDILHVKPFIYTVAFQFLVAVGAHFGLLKPISLTGTAGAIQTAAPAGIGGQSSMPGNVAPPQ
jgi:hypothetical protein